MGCLSPGSDDYLCVMAALLTNARALLWARTHACRAHVTRPRTTRWNLPAREELQSSAPPHRQKDRTSGPACMCLSIGDGWVGGDAKGKRAGKTDHHKEEWQKEALQSHLDRECVDLQIYLSISVYIHHCSYSRHCVRLFPSVIARMCLCSAMYTPAMTCLRAIRRSPHTRCSVL